MNVLKLVSEPEARGRIRLSCWGDFALEDAATGASLRPRGRKARALVAYLALHGGRPVSRERITGLLWGDRAEEQARASLRQAIHELKALANGGHEALQIGRDQLFLLPGRFRTELDEMRDALARRDYAALLQALPHPDERLFADLDGIDEGFDDWLRIERTRQRDALAALLAEAVEAAAHDGNQAAARALAARHREIDPAAPQPRLPELPATAPEIEAPVSAKPGLPKRWRLAALLVALLLAGLVAIVAWQTRRPVSASPPTIAVLPFRNLSGAGGVAFADGLSEEVMTQLAREPGVKVAGRTSAWQFKDHSADLGEIGRRLGVAYVLEGSVRSVGPRIRVNVALAKTSDGLQLWAETFDGTLDDILTIQHQIGAKVAGALGRKLSASHTAPTTSGEVYSLYLSARSLIRERNPRAFMEAGQLLERALALDPDFAPALASQAQVKRFEGNRPGLEGARARAEALADARRALALAPDLAQAHGVLGMVLGFEDPAGGRHIERAAALDPTNAEFQFWLGHVRASRSDFPGAHVAYRNAFTLDPLWPLAYEYAVGHAWDMGHREEAFAVIHRVEREGSRRDGHLARAQLALKSGDLSEAAARLGAAQAATQDLGKQSVAAFLRAGILLQLRMEEEATKEWAASHRLWAKQETRPLLMPERHGAHLALRQGKLPTAAELARANLSEDPAAESLLLAMARHLITAGQARMVADLYDRGAGRLGHVGLVKASMTRDRALHHAPVAAVALRSVGRGEEADLLLQRAGAAIAEIMRRSRGRMPASMWGEAAQIWALLGRRDAALSALDRAIGNGWRGTDYVSGDLIDDLSEDPAFAGLRGDARFEAIRGRMNADLARERKELIRDLNSAPRTI